MHCTICGLPTHNIVGSVLPQCKCGWQAPQPPQAQRTWIGLTNNEIALINADYPHPQGFARAIEAKLKEKNSA